MVATTSITATTSFSTPNQPPSLAPIPVSNGTPQPSSGGSVLWQDFYFIKYSSFLYIYIICSSAGAAILFLFYHFPLYLVAVKFK
jgi:hypothetical protein